MFPLHTTPDFSYLPSLRLLIVIEVKLAGFAAGVAGGVAAVKSWLGSRPEPERFVPSSPTADVVADPPPKAKKKVSFREDLNEVHEVEYWFDRRIHKHREIRFGWGVVVTLVVSRWIEPDGHNQLHFPRTKWVRDVPDWSAEDDDGDVEMD